MTHEFVTGDSRGQWFVLAEDRLLDDAVKSGRWIKTTDPAELEP